MIYFITGGCGFLGSNIAAEVLKKREKLIIFDNLSRAGSEKNLEWLKRQGAFQFIQGDIRNQKDIEKTIFKSRPDVIFHLAGQVSMTTSISNPRLDFDVNAVGTFNLLDAVRKNSPDTIIIYSSTNKVYGDLEWVHFKEMDSRYTSPDYPNGFPETIPLDFQSPYGCSKGTADQYMLDFHRIFGLRTIVFRHSTIYGARQFALYDQGWIGWFCQKAIEIEKGFLKAPFTISGNGKQIRDVLYVDDAVNLYFQAVDHVELAKGNAFNIGGGIQNSLSLLELFTFLDSELNISMNFKKLKARKSDQKIFVADISKAANSIKWFPKTNKSTGIRKVLKWTASQV